MLSALFLAGFLAGLCGAIRSPAAVAAEPGAGAAHADATGGAAEAAVGGHTPAGTPLKEEPPGRADGKPAQPSGNLIGHGGPVKAVAADAQAGLVVTGSFDYSMMVWRVSEDDSPRVAFRFDDHDGAVNAVSFVPGRRLALSAGDAGRLSVWDLKTGARIAQLQGHTAKVVDMAVAADGQMAVTASWDRTARLWSLAGAKPEPGPILAGHQGPVNAAAFSADGAHVFTAGYDGQVRLFDARTGEMVRPVYKHGWGINVLLRLPDSNLLAFGALNGTAGVLDPATGEIVAELGESDRPVLAIAATAQPGLVAVGGGDGKVRVYRLGDYAAIESYENPYGPAWGLAFAPGGRALYIAGLDDFVYRWTITPRQPFEEIDSPYPRRFQVDADSDDPIARGRVHFMRKCSVCHTLKADGRNRAGPTLYGLFGRRIATVAGYPYSEALKSMDIVWTEETVGKLFELGPEHFTPGSKMPLQKMSDTAERNALIAYLKTTPAAGDGSPQRGNANVNEEEK